MLLACDRVYCSQLLKVERHHLDAGESADPTHSVATGGVRTPLPFVPVTAEVSHIYTLWPCLLLGVHCSLGESEA